MPAAPALPLVPAVPLPALPVLLAAPLVPAAPFVPAAPLPSLEPGAQPNATNIAAPSAAEAIKRRERSSPE